MSSVLKPEHVEAIFKTHRAKSSIIFPYSPTQWRGEAIYGSPSRARRYRFRIPADSFNRGFVNALAADLCAKWIDDEARHQRRADWPVKVYER